MTNELATIKTASAGGPCSRRRGRRSGVNKRAKRIYRKAVTREELERIARIIGSASAAQRALDCADEYGGEVQFWRCGEVIFVERVDDIEVNHFDGEFWK